MSAVSVNIDSKVYTKLEKISALTGIEKHTITEQALEQYLLELQEDIEDAKIGQKAWEEFLTGDQKTYSLDEVKKELGL